jgi:hypothetical protein
MGKDSIRLLVAVEKLLDFQTQRDSKIQAGTDSNSLGNRCSARWHGPTSSRVCARGQMMGGLLVCTCFRHTVCDRPPVTANVNNSLKVKKFASPYFLTTLGGTARLPRLSSIPGGRGARCYGFDVHHRGKRHGSGNQISSHARLRLCILRNRPTNRRDAGNILCRWPARAVLWCASSWLVLARAWLARRAQWSIPCLLNCIPETR